MKKIALVLVLATTGCEPTDTVVKHLELAPTGNPEVNLQVLFVRHGCEVSRFWDNRKPVYLTLCPGGKSTATSSYTESCGKSCTKKVTVPQIQDTSPPPSQSPEIPGCPQPPMILLEATP